MVSPYYFVDEISKIDFKISLESHNVNHVNSILINAPNFLEFGFEVRYINEIIKEISVFYARLINQYKFRHHTLFSPSF